MLYTSIFDFSFTSLSGEIVDLSDFKGKPVLLVNTASLCGKTPQYAALQELQDLVGEKITIIGFPSNDFGQQEPGSNAEIKEFCEDQYKVSFLMSEKVQVIGDDMHPIFAWLTEQENPDYTGEIQWNFEKFVLNAEGALIARFRSDVHPADPLILEELGVSGDIQ